jgi:hypothetical protein
VEEIAKPGQLAVFDLSDFVHLKERQIILTYFARKLFDVRRRNLIPPFIFFVEEAHQFAPEGEETELAKRVDKIAGGVKDMNDCIFNLHVPPKDSGLDTAPMVDASTYPPKPVTEFGQIKFVGAGSTGGPLPLFTAIAAELSITVYDLANSLFIFLTIFGMMISFIVGNRDKI